MGSRSSKPAADPLDQSFQPLLDVVDKFTNVKPGTEGDLLSVQNYAGICAVAGNLFGTIKQLVEVDITHLPKQQQASYMDLLDDYFSLLDRLHRFINHQTAVFRILVDETQESEPNEEVIKRAFGEINSNGCLDFLDEVEKLIKRVVKEEKVVSGAVSTRIERAVAYGAVGAFALVVLIGSGIGFAFLAATAAAIATTVALSSYSALGMFLQLRNCLKEAENLKGLREKLTMMKEHLTLIKESMSDTQVSYKEVLDKGYTHKRLGESAKKCLVNLERARDILLDRKPAGKKGASQLNV
jgi:hypothetical protein